MKNLITLYQKYRNHITITTSALFIACMITNLVALAYGYPIVPSLYVILSLYVIVEAWFTAVDARHDIIYGEDEYQDNIAQIVINIDTDEMDIHSVVEKINKALNNESEK